MSTSSAQKTAHSKPVTQLQTQDLVAGDIIATRNDSVSSKFIRGATGGPVSHTILYTGGKMGAHHAVDATPENGVTRDLLHQKLQHVSYAAVLRHTTATTEDLARACQWAELQALRHKPYDFKTAVRVGRFTKYSSVGCLVILSDEVSARLSYEGEDASFMCSELVFRAFEVAGVPLIDKPAHHLSPAMIFKTQRLAFLGRLV